VLVLIPGGEFTLGAQSHDPRATAYDPAAQANEGPPHAVALEPFFLAKHELTQAQWQRLNGENPSQFDAGSSLGRQYHTVMNPVEQVSWIDCERTLQRMDLVLPTEAQWEYAARAGTLTPWWTGERVETLNGAANLPDAAVLQARMTWPEAVAVPELDDEYVAHAPVDALRPNPFGLHHVHGNVWEWCRDWLVRYEVPARAGDGERLSAGESTRERVIRGGSFNYAPERARCSSRFGVPPTLRQNSIGVRPARAIAR
jgi:formylglycine-generating enzyme required for sulfatase activity